MEHFRDFMQKHPDINIKILTSGAIYKILLTDDNYVPIIVGKNPTINFSPIFKALEDNLMSPEIRNVCYKAVHNVLSINSRLQRFGIIDNFLCPSCKSHIEDLEHLFCGCLVTNKLWAMLEDILLNLCNHRLKKSFKLMVYGIIEVNINSTVKSLVRLILGIAKYCIWTARCNLVYERKIFDDDYLVSFFKATLKYRVLTDAYRFADQKFKNIWCINNVICAKSGSHVDFLL